MQRQLTPVSVRGAESRMTFPTRAPPRGRGQIQQQQHPQQRGGTTATSASSAHVASPTLPAQSSRQRQSQTYTDDGSADAESREKERERVMMAEYRASMPPVDFNGYWMNTLSRIQDDDLVLNPLGANVSSSQISLVDGAPVASEASESSLDANVAAIAEKLAAPSLPVDVTWPVGHYAIDDVRLHYDSLITSAAYGGYASGDVPIQFAAHNSMQSPTRVVKVTISKFYFPHIYLATNTIFDFFYLRSVFLSLNIIPTSHLVQTATPNSLFTYELHVTDVDSNAITLEPINPTFCLKQAVTISDNMIASFRTRAPNGSGFIPCPIPPIRIHATRTATDAISTTFTLGTQYIGAIAPGGATYTVPVFIRAFNAIPTPFELALINAVGYQASAFTTIGNTFSIPISTLAFPPGVATDVYVFVPKNSFNFTIRFSCAQTGVTNGLFPIHS